jgi:hypothetical protein
MLPRSYFPVKALPETLLNFIGLLEGATNAGSRLLGTQPPPVNTWPAPFFQFKHHFTPVVLHLVYIPATGF